MPEFSYSARDANGQPQNGVQAADSPGQLTAQLRGRGWVVLDIAPAAGSSLSVGAMLSRGHPRYWLPPSRLDVELGLHQLATMLRSGLTLLSSLRTAADQARRPAMANVWKQVARQVEEGSTLAEALGSHRRLFPPMVVQLVNVGEQSGSLDVVMNRAATHLERSRTLRGALLTSLMYPAFVLLAAVGVSTFMVVSLIPKLQKFLVGRGRRLPPMSQMLLDASAWINGHGTVILLVLLGVLVGCVVLWRWPRSRGGIDRCLLRLPILGNLFRLAGTATVARGLSILLDSGIALLGALQVVQALLGNRAMQQRVGAARASVMEGGTLADGLLQGGEFSPMLGRMTAVGEATGTLGSVLNEVAEFHESQLAAVVRRFSALIEPVTIVIVGGIVGFVYIAFFMALFSVAGGGR
jgi:type II secretory pathway component PulF